MDYIKSFMIGATISLVTISVLIGLITVVNGITNNVKVSAALVSLLIGGGVIATFARWLQRQ